MAEENEEPPAPVRVTRAEHARVLGELNALRDEIEAVRGERDTAKREAGGLRGEVTKLKGAAETAAAERAAADAKAQGDRDEAVKAVREEARGRVVQAEVRTQAIQAGIVDLDGLRLADLSAIKVSDDGVVEGADAAIASLRETKPYLFGAAPKPGGTPGGNPPPARPGGPVDARTLSRDAWLAERAKLPGLARH